MKFESLENKMSTFRSSKMFRPQIKAKQLFLGSSGSTDSVFKELPIDLHGNNRLMLLLLIIILILTLSNFGAGMYVLLTRAWNSDVTNGFVSRNIMNMLRIIPLFFWKYCSSTQLTTLSNILWALPQRAQQVGWDTADMLFLPIRGNTEILMDNGRCVLATCS